MSKGKTSSRAWKALESRFCRIWNTERVGATGENTPDGVLVGKLVRMVVLSAEVKLVGQLVKQVQAAVDQAERNKLSDRHLPVAYLKEKHSNDDTGIVAMRLSTFKKFFDLEYNFNPNNREEIETILRSW